MGMFDEVFIVGKVRCPKCGGRLPPATRFQTKDLHPAMNLYKVEGARMYKSVGVLPEYKSVWTAEDAEAHNKDLKDKYPSNLLGVHTLWSVAEGDERLLDGEHTMEAQEWNSMGELPHQHLTVYTHCENCPNGNVDVHMKFTDGVCVEYKEEYDDWEIDTDTAADGD